MKARPQGAKPSAKPPSDNRASIIHQRAQVYACPNSLSDDFRVSCQTLREDAAIEIDFARVAIEIWSGRDGRPAELRRILSDYLEEQRRHDAALAALGQRFDAFCFEEATPHDHIEHIEPIQRLLRDWVFYDPPKT